MCARQPDLTHVARSARALWDRRERITRCRAWARNSRWPASGSVRSRRKRP